MSGIESKPQQSSAEESQYEEITLRSSSRLTASRAFTNEEELQASDRSTRETAFVPSSYDTPASDKIEGTFEGDVAEEGSARPTNPAPVGNGGQIAKFLYQHLKVFRIICIVLAVYGGIITVVGFFIFSGEGPLKGFLMEHSKPTNPLKGFVEKVRKTFTEVPAVDEEVPEVVFMNRHISTIVTIGIQTMVFAGFSLVVTFLSKCVTKWLFLGVYGANLAFQSFSRVNTRCDKVLDELNKFLPEYKGLSDTGESSLVLNNLMIAFQCCGVYDYRDFEDYSKKWPSKESNSILPNIKPFNIEAEYMTPIACCKNASLVEYGCFTDEIASEINTNMHVGCLYEITKLIIEDERGRPVICFLFILLFVYYVYLGSLLYKAINTPQNENNANGGQEIAEEHQTGQVHKDVSNQRDKSSTSTYDERGRRRSTLIH